MDTLIIGIGHKARHGKDTVARILSQHDPKRVRVYSWAAALKAVCRAVLGMRGKDGLLLQIVGTDIFRASPTERAFGLARLAGSHPHLLPRAYALAAVLEHNPQVWVETLLDQIAEEAPAVALIPDTRFPNEAAACHATIRVSRVTPDGTAHVCADRDPLHPSETALDDYPNWTATIRNVEGEHGSLAAQAIAAYEAIRTAPYPGAIKGAGGWSPRR